MNKNIRGGVKVFIIFLVLLSLFSSPFSFAFVQGVNLNQTNTSSQNTSLTNISLYDDSFGMLEHITTNETLHTNSELLDVFENMTYDGLNTSFSTSNESDTIALTTTTNSTQTTADTVVITTSNSTNSSNTTSTSNTSIVPTSVTPAVENATNSSSLVPQTNITPIFNSSELHNQTSNSSISLTLVSSSGQQRVVKTTLLDTYIPLTTKRDSLHNELAKEQNRFSSKLQRLEEEQNLQVVSEPTNPSAQPLDISFEEINSDLSVKQLRFKDLDVTKNTGLGIEQVSSEKNKKQELAFFEEVYAIDPSKLSFTQATALVQAPATGGWVYKCAAWDFESQTCPEPITTCEGTTKEDTVCTTIGGWEKQQYVEPNSFYVLELSPVDPAYGVYNATWTAPYCGDTGEAPCIVNTSVLECAGNQNSPGPEPNQPNTIDSCSDSGTLGTCRSDESVENVTIENLNFTTFRVGDTVRVNYTVWCWGTADRVALYYANNASSPTWQRITAGNPVCAAGGTFETFSETFVLDDSVGPQAIRAINKYNSDIVTACDGASYTDYDDVVFEVVVANTPPTTPTTIICDGGSCNETFEDQITLQCNGSTDAEADTITYSLFANYLANSTSSNALSSTSSLSILNVSGIEATITLFNESFPNADASWTGDDDGDTAQDEYWIVDQEVGDETSIRIANDNTPPSSPNVLHWQECDPNNFNGCYAQARQSDGSSWDPSTEGWNSASITFTWDYYVDTAEGIQFSTWDGTTWTSRFEQLATGNNEQPGWTTTTHELTSAELAYSEFAFRFSADAQANADEVWLDDVVFTASITNYSQTQQITSYAMYEDIYTSLTNASELTFIIEVDSYSPIASVQETTADPDLELEVYDGTSWVSLGTLGLPSTYTGTGLDTTNHNFSVSTTNAQVLTAWETLTNQDVRIRAVGIDSVNNSYYDEINYSGMWVRAEEKTWRTVGTHTQGNSYIWDISTYEDQSGVLLRCYATDLAGSAQSSANFTTTTATTFGTVALQAPFVQLTSPAQSYVSTSSTVLFTCNAIDDGTLDTLALYHNIGQAFGEAQAYSASGSSDSNSFTVNSIADGTYLWNCFANDTLGLSSFAIPNRTLTVDATAPSVTNIVPVATTPFAILETITISADVTDASGVNSVRAQIDYPNTTTQTIELSTQVGDTFSASFTLPTLQGRYNITILSNDTYGTQNNSQTSYFEIVDSYPEVTALTTPANAASLTQTNITFNFTTTDDVNTTLANCSIYVNKSGTWELQTTLFDVANNTPTTTTLLVPDGSFVWNVQCYDQAGLADWFDTNNTFTVETQPQALILYEDGTSTIQYREFNEYNYTGLEQNSGLVLTNTPRWIKAIANHEREEVLAVTLDASRDIFAQIYSPVTNTWSHQQILGFNIPNTGVRSIDVAYEEVSGDALILYEPTALADNQISYVVWNGVSYSAPQTLTLPVSEDIHWIELASLKGTDTIMALLHTDASTLLATLWNGTSFETVTTLTTSSSSTSATEENFAFSWESQSQEGLVVYGEGTSLVYRTYTNSWQPSSTIGIGDSLDAVRLCAQTDSNYVGAIWQDEGNDVNARVWDGSGFLTAPPTQDDNAEPNGANTANVDCYWVNETTALFGFVDWDRLYVDYFTFTKSNTWDIAAMSSASTSSVFAQDDISSLRFFESPLTTGMFILSQDIAQSTSGIFYTGSEFVTQDQVPLTTNSGVLNGGQQSSYVAWYRYDATPNVTNIIPTNATTYEIGDTVTVFVDVVDDDKVDTVQAQITYPNTTTQTITLVDSSVNGTYNSSFTLPNLTGNYEVRIIANDTSVYQNINNTEFVTLVVQDTTVPVVVLNSPQPSTSLAPSSSLNISVNATDAATIDAVIAQIDYPNTTSENISLSLVNDQIYAYLWTTPTLQGDYNITFFVNDSSNNQNNSVTTNFTIEDAGGPQVTNVLPVTASQIEFSSSVTIAANVTDDIAVDKVFANITYTINSSQVALEELSFTSGSTYQTTYLPTTLANYTVTILANDSQGTLNDTQSTTFEVVDTTAPSVSALLPTSGSVYDQEELITLQATVTDAYGVDSVIARIVYPNAAQTDVTLSDAGSNIYNASWTVPNMTGTYTVTILANDSSTNNTNSSVTSTFSVVDITNPIITIVEPATATTVLNTTTVEFTCNASDNYNLSTIQLYFQNESPVLFETGFDSTNLSEWSFDSYYGDEENWQVTDGVLEYFNGGGMEIIYTGNTSWQNYTIQALVKDSGYYPVGIVFYYKNANDYWRYLSEDSRMLVRGRVDSNWVNAGDLSSSAFAVDDLELDRWYWFKANMNGTHIKVKHWARNETEPSSWEMDIQETRIDGGAIGLMGWSGSSSFDNVTVTSQDGYVAQDSFILNQTQLVTGTSASAQFDVDLTNGDYVWTCKATDQEGNTHLYSPAHTITISEDSDAPTMSSLQPTNATIVEPEDTMTLSASITDYSALDVTRVLVSYPNSSFEYVSLVDVGGDLFSGSFTVPVLVGRYNLTFFANDSRGNTVTQEAYVIAQDTTNPQVSSLQPVDATTVEAQSIISINATITDAFPLSSTLVTVVYPNTTSQTISLSDAGSNVFNASFTVPVLVGRYNLTFFANDTNGNENNSQTSHVIAQDTTNPIITGFSPANATSFEAGQTINLELNATDLFTLSSAYTYITYPNTTTQNSILTKQSATLFNATFTAPVLVGNYSAQTVVIDENNNQQTSTSWFIINDTLAPQTTITQPLAATYEVGSTQAISTTALDLVAVDDVVLQINYPNSTLYQNVSLSAPLPPTYTSSFSVPYTLGNYSVRVFANDTSSNSNSSTTSWFVAQDTTQPSVSLITPLVGSTIVTSSPVSILLSATDAMGVDTVRINITYPDTSSEIFETDSQGANIYNLTFINTTNPGLYTIKVLVNDSSNNTNTNAQRTFLVQDNNEPVINLYSPQDGVYKTVSDVNLTCNATDNTALANISLYTNQTSWSLKETKTVTGTTNSSIFELTSLADDAYMWNCEVYDSSSNSKFANQNYTFIVDTTNPSVTTLLSDAQEFNFSQTISLGATLVDTNGISLAQVNVSYPSGAWSLLDLDTIVGDDYSTTIAANETGAFTLYYIINDSANNVNDSVSSTFTVVDVVAPQASLAIPSQASIYEVNQTIAVSALISDDVQVDTVQAIITYPNTSIHTIPLLNSVGQTYNSTFTIPYLLGRYNVSYVANDTSANENTTLTTYFVAQDSQVPSISNPVPSPSSSHTINETLILGVNASDLVNLSSVQATLTYPNSTQETVSLSLLSATYYQTSIIVPEVLGTIHITFAATDSSGNTNSTTTNISTQDILPPRVTNPQPSGATYEVEDVISLNATITDQIAVDTAWVNITLPNTTELSFDLSQVLLSDVYAYSYALANKTGTYSLQFFANDSSVNTNSTTTSTFTVQDTSAPQVSILNPLQGFSLPIGSSEELLVQAIDLVGVVSVNATILYPNTTTQELSLSSIGSNQYNATITAPNLLGQYKITITATDSSANTNNSVSQNFTVVDPYSPLVSSAQPTASSIFEIYETINVSLIATDTIEVDSVVATILYPNTTTQELTLTPTGSNYSSEFTIPSFKGVYEISFLATDSSGNTNTSTTNFTAQDVFAPQVTIVSPTSGQSIATSEILTINASITDDSSLTTTQAQITQPNTTTTFVTLTQEGATNYYSNVYTIPEDIGSYTVQIIANDSSGNANTTEIVTFTGVDVVAPTLSGLSCVPSTINLTQSTTCFATITDTFGVDTVQANITLPDSSTVSATVLGSEPNFNFTYASAALTGTYSVTWWANDTSNNTNTSTASFVTQDVTAPQIYIETVNNYETSSATPTLSFNASDNYDTTLSCSLHVDDVLQSTNASVVVNTSTNMTTLSQTEGEHTYYISCMDNSANILNSSTQTFVVDQSGVNFISLDTTPITADDVDPNETITVYAQVNDSLTSVANVTLQYKLSIASVFNSTTLTYNVSSGYYEGTFIPTQEGTYQLQLVSYDAVANDATSAQVELVVAYDYTWTISPDDLGVTSATINQNHSLGNFTIENTGDYELNFTTSSNSNTTYYSSKENFTLAAKASKTIEVFDLADEIINVVELTITPAYAGTNLSSQAVQGTLVVSQGEPVLSSVFVVPTTATQTLEQGATTVPYQVRLSNIGTANATNVTLNISYPSEWDLAFGVQSIFFSEFNVGETYDHLIEVDIPQDATVGTYTVLANATGIYYNDSNATNSTNISLVFSDSVLVTIEEDAVLGTAVETTSPSSPSTTTSSPGSAATGSGFIGGVLRGIQVVNSSEVVEIVRGQNESFFITVENIFPYTTLSNINIVLDGYLTDYLTVIVPNSTTLGYEEIAEFEVIITSPEYLDLGSYDLSAFITGSLTGAGINDVLEEEREITLIVRSMSQEDLEELFAIAREKIALLENEDFSTSLITGLLTDAQELANQRLYDRAQELAFEIVAIADLAFEVQETIDDIYKKMDIYQSFTSKFLGLEKDFPQTRSLLELAQAALLREDYNTALTRLENAELSLALEAGEFSFLFFIIDYWWAILLAILAATLLSIILYRRIGQLIIQRKLLGAIDREKEIRKQMRTVQEQRFTKKSMGAKTYFDKFDQLTKNLALVRTQQTTLRHKKSRLFSSKKVVEDLRAERSEVQKQLKDLQKKYFVQKNMSKTEYGGLHEMYADRLSQIENEYLTAELSFAKKGKTL